MILGVIVSREPLMATIRSSRQAAIWLGTSFVVRLFILSLSLLLVVFSASSTTSFVGKDTCSVSISFDNARVVCQDVAIALGDARML